MARQNILVEAFYDGDWQDITSRVRTRTGISISRGAGDEHATAPPSTCTLTVDNRDGWANPRNPASALYGKAGRNTPLRVWSGPDPILDDTFNRTVASGWTGGTFTWTLSGGTVPDDYSIGGTRGSQISTTVGVFRQGIVDTGNSDQRVRATWDWSAGTITGGNATVLLLGRFTDGDNHYRLEVTYTPAGAVSVRLGKRAGGVFTALGSTLSTHSGYSGLFATYSFTAELYIERDRLYAKIWDSSNFDEPNFWHLTATDTSLTTGTQAGVASRRETGNTNTNLAARFDQFTATPGPTRFTGEISSWRPRRDIRGDAWTTVTASGITRRLGQGTDPILPAANQGVLDNSPIAYWPLDDLVDSQQARSGLTGGTPMVAQTTAVDFTEESTAGAAGSVAPSLAAGNSLIGQVSGGSSTGWSYAFWVKGLAGEQSGVTKPFVEPLFVWEQDRRTVWILKLISNTDIAFQSIFVTRTVPLSGVTDPFIAINGAAGNVLDDQWHLIQVIAAQSAPGAQLDAFLYIDGVLVGSDSDGAPPVNLAPPRFVEVIGIEAGIAASLDMDHLNVAQIAVFDGATQPVLYNAALGRPGELAGTRFLRLCAEQDITAYVIGDEDDTRPMGAQYSDTLINHLREIEATDDGILLEPRHDRALALITGRSRYNRASVLDLDFDVDGQVSPPLDPDIDDLSTRNDVTVTRRNGSSAHAVQETGPLNVQDPGDDPDGVGRVTTSVTVNPESDTDLPNYATWLKHLGTIDETRFPQVTVNLAAPGAAGIAAAAGRVDVADRITVSNIPELPDPASLIVLGYTEVIESHQRIITYNCMPEVAYRVGVYDDSRYDTAGSTLSTAAAAGTVGALNPNASFDTDTSGWVGSNATIARSTAEFHDSPASVLVTPDGVGTSGGVNAAARVAVTAGQVYVARLWVNSPAGWSDLRPAVDWQTQVVGGSFVSSSLGSASVVAADTWTQIWALYTAPPTAAGATMRGRHAGTPAATDIWYADQIELLPTMTLSVATATGPLWTTRAGAFPFDIIVGGERMTVYSITGSSSPQTFTVVRSVNGISKAHAAAAPVRLFTQARYAL